RFSRDWSSDVCSSDLFPALPGTPRYDPALGIDGMVERMRQDLRHLFAAGVDAVMFCNEDDRPYSFHADFEAVAMMTRVITELRQIGRAACRERGTEHG